jgi:Flp pilus assembly protein TadG
MSDWSSRFAACQRGAVAVEAAICAPFLLVVLMGLVECGRALSHANALEKGLRAGAMYVARSPLPLDEAATLAAGNLVRRGTVDAGAPFLIPGWAEAGAGVTVTPLEDFVTHGVAVPVFRVAATVPYVPILPGAPRFTITRSHEQAYIGR